MHSQWFGPVTEFNQHVLTISSEAEFHGFLENYLRWWQLFLDEQGQLEPNHRLAPLTGGFMQPPAVAQREQMPVLKEPVEGW